MRWGDHSSYVALDEADSEVQVMGRLARVLAPLGVGFLLFAALLASSSWVCNEECIRSAEALDEQLLDCEERCSVSGRDPTETGTCKERCTAKLGFTSNRVRRDEVSCKKTCGRSPVLLRSVSFVGTVALLCVTPLLGAYKGACYCECCVGKGCTPRLALFNVAWVSYGFSILWSLPAVVEDSGEIGGKVLFTMTQGVAVVAMAGSRFFWDKEQHRGVRAADRQLGVVVGAPVEGPSTAELQEQVLELQRQVKELLQRQIKLADALAERGVQRDSLT